MKVSSSGAWLDVEFGSTHRVLSWALIGGAFVDADLVSWRQVTDSDLREDIDPLDWLERDLHRRGRRSDVVFLTSRRLSNWERADASVDGVQATVIATVGLGNALRVGHAGGLVRPADHRPESVAMPGSSATGWGTINILCRASVELSDAALIEALSLVAEARTLAITGRRLQVEGGDATGTGTDCIAVAATRGGAERVGYAGKHTAIGQAIGLAVREAVGRGADRWLAERGSMAARRPKHP